MHFNAQRHVDARADRSRDRPGRCPGAKGRPARSSTPPSTRDATPVVRYRSRDHARGGRRWAAPAAAPSPRIRCIGRTDDMLIYKGMNVFPTAIRDLVVRALRRQDRADAAAVEGRAATRCGSIEPIEVDVEASAPLDDARAQAALAREIEDAVRSQLQVRIAVTVLRARRPAARRLQERDRGSARVIAPSPACGRGPGRGPCSATTPHPRPLPAARGEGVKARARPGRGGRARRSRPAPRPPAKAGRCAAPARGGRRRAAPAARARRLGRRPRAAAC